MTDDRENSSGKTVLVGMTGRIDSAVAAYLLKKQGLNVIGIAIVTGNANMFKDPELLPHCHLSNLEQVKNLCNVIGIQFYATDAAAQYEYEVLDSFVAGRLSAKAENSCFNCTRMRMEILFQKMQQLDADYIATGHYAKVYRNIHSGQYFVHSNNDVQSDQSFMLGGLSEKILEKLQLPLGDLRKVDVIKIVKRFNLPVTTEGSDRQCYKKKSAIEQLIHQRVPKSMITEGQSYSKATGIFTGDHDGLPFHYIGEKNLKLKNVPSTDKDAVVVDYNFEQKALILGSEADLTFTGANVVNLYMSKGIDMSHPIRCYLKFKHATEFMACTLYFKNSQSGMLQFEKPMYPVVANENLVFFESNGRNAKVIGRGKINRPGEFKFLDRVKDFRRSDEDEQNAASGKKESDVFKF